MSGRYLRGATFHRYGTTLYVGLGLPIPIINERVAKTVSAKDSEIMTDLLDYGVPSRNRPTVKKVSYEELKSGKVLVGDLEMRSSPLSSFRMAEEVAQSLRDWILEKRFLLNRPAELLPAERDFKPLLERNAIKAEARS